MRPIAVDGPSAFPKDLRKHCEEMQVLQALQHGFGSPRAVPFFGKKGAT